MVNKLNVVDALNFIDPSNTDYDSWLRVGMALNNATKEDPSITWKDWDDWSKRDSRPGMYQPGLCEKKWAGFHPDGGVSEATIFQLAFANGYKVNDAFDWNSEINFDGECWNGAVADLKQFINLLFYPEDTINYCLTAKYDEAKDKYHPASKGINRNAGELLEKLEHYGDINNALGDYNENAGGWIRFNPMDGNGVKNENVTSYRYCLIESDSLSLNEQLKKIISLKLPCQTILTSGNKSIHAIMRIDAKDAKEYKDRVLWTFNVLDENGFNVDRNNQNPSRMCRMPGLKRGDSYQELISGRIGLPSFEEWKDYIENGMDDELLPEVESYSDIVKNPPPLKEELIEGVLRRGHKMIISGASKSGKSFSLIDLMSCVAEGKEWLGFKCQKGKVLYLNFEIDRASFFERIRKVYEAKGWEPTTENIDVWNLRGKTMAISKLVPKLLQRARNKDYSLIVLDPIYKIQAGDENSAGDIAKFTNEVDKIATELDSSIVYCHHHSKGSQGFKRAMDRSSGSGVFSRDADAIIDVIELSNDEYKDMEHYGELRAFRIEGTLREFPSFEPVNVFYDFPIYRLDENGILDNSKTLDEFLLSRQNNKMLRDQKEPATKRFIESFARLNVTGDGVPKEELMIDLNIKERRLKDIMTQINKEAGKKIYYSKNRKVYRTDTGQSN